MALCAKLVCHGATLVYLLNCCATILVMSGLASLTNLCLEDEIVASNGRKLLLSYADLTSDCSAAFRFEWWGWALQVTFLSLLGFHWANNCKNAGVMVIGGTSTVLCMLFADGQRQVYPDLVGKAFSSSSLLFVGWLLVATFNYLLFMVDGYQGTTSCNTSCSAHTATAAATGSAVSTGKKPAAGGAEHVMVSAGSAGTAGTMPAETA